MIFNVDFQDFNNNFSEEENMIALQLVILRI